MPHRIVNVTNAAISGGFRSIFATRSIVVHDGSRLRRVRLGGRVQAVAAAAGVMTLGFSAYGMAHAVADAGVTADATPEAKVADMQHQVATMRADVARLRDTARAHAARIDQRQAALVAMLSGKGDVDGLALAALQPHDHADPHAGVVTRPFDRVVRRQAAIAGEARAVVDARYADATRQMRRLGISPRKVMPAMGGPFEPVDPSVQPVAGAEAAADQQFRALFMSWKKLDTLEQASIAIPSFQPVANLSLTSNFGVRSDPFRGTAAMHAGVDIPGPIGTPVYATADGIIGRAQRAGGYGNLIEINHGKGIQTRYGHLSKIIVTANAKVKRGQLIGLMGSTGRSTGSHLHYEVRIDGAAVNPLPYLQATELAMAADRAQRTRLAMGGPAN